MTEIQKILLTLIELATFNSFDGKKVVQDLKAHSGLWRSVLMNREDPVFVLRDIQENHYNVDVLYVWSSGQDDEALESLARSWGPDAVSWDEDPRNTLGAYGEALPNILRLWWD